MKEMTRMNQLKEAAKEIAVAHAVEAVRLEKIYGRPIGEKNPATWVGLADNASRDLREYGEKNEIDVSRAIGNFKTMMTFRETILAEYRAEKERIKAQN